MDRTPRSNNVIGNENSDTGNLLSEMNYTIDDHNVAMSFFRPPSPIHGHDLLTEDQSGYLIYSQINNQQECAFNEVGGVSESSHDNFGEPESSARHARILANHDHIASEAILINENISLKGNCSGRAQLAVSADDFPDDSIAMQRVRRRETEGGGNYTQRKMRRRRADEGESEISPNESGRVTMPPNPGPLSTNFDDGLGRIVHVAQQLKYHGGNITRPPWNVDQLSPHSASVQLEVEELPRQRQLLQAELQPAPPPQQQRAQMATPPPPRTPLQQHQQQPLAALTLESVQALEARLPLAAAAAALGVSPAELRSACRRLRPGW